MCNNMNNMNDNINDNNNANEIVITLPAWFPKNLAGAYDAFEIAVQDNTKSQAQSQVDNQTIKQMSFVIKLAEDNVCEKTGGPFAAAVFNDVTGEIIAAGVNLVTSCGLSAAHAEIVALSFAQKVLGTFDLGAENLPPCRLVTSTEPCAMCLGAIPWSGVCSVVCGARDEDARAAGFDEGSKRDDWVLQLERRNIKVVRDVLRSQAADVLKNYAINGGIIYNGKFTESAL